MTRRERHEVAVTVRAVMEDECDEIREAYLARFGSLRGLRKYVRTEALAYWTPPFDPYLDREYLDIAWLRVGDRIVNYDDFWCMVRDGLKDGRYEQP